MKTATTKTGLKIKASVKAGAIGPFNHNRPALKVRAGVKAGGIGQHNHNRSALKVRTGVKAGELLAVRNHSSRLIAL
jgi:hypothetical protein